MSYYTSESIEKPALQTYRCSLERQVKTCALYYSRESSFSLDDLFIWQQQRCSSVHFCITSTCQHQCQWFIYLTFSVFDPVNLCNTLPSAQNPTEVYCPHPSWCVLLKRSSGELGPHIVFSKQTLLNDDFCSSVKHTHTHARLSGPFAHTHARTRHFTHTLYNVSWHAGPVRTVQTCHDTFKVSTMNIWIIKETQETEC